MRTVLRGNRFADVQAPRGLARDRRSPASTSTRANAGDGVGLRPSPSPEDTRMRADYSHGVLRHQSARALRTCREACRAELTVATDATPFNGSVWLACAGAIPQGNASAHGPASDSASARTAASKPHSEGSGSARRPGPVPGAWSPLSPASARFHRHHSFKKDDPWIRPLF
jgi:hypothetical protein